MIIEFVIPALVFGLSAGLSPGPLSIIIIQETISKGFRHGMLASFAPIFTDGPIIFCVLMVLKQFQHLPLLLGIVSLGGAVYLFKLGYANIKSKQIDIDKELDESASISKAIKVNFLNPNPYLFWFTIGGPFLMKGTGVESAMFISVGVSTLILCKIAISYLTSKSRRFIGGAAYVNIMRLLGILLIIYGFIFLSRSYTYIILKQ